MTKMTKNKLKNILENKIKAFLEEKIQQLAKEKTKTRFCSNWEKKTYIEQMGYQEAKLITKCKLNMLQ